MNVSEVEELVIGKHPGFEKLREADEDFNLLVWSLAEKIAEILKETEGTIVIELDAETTEMAERYYNIYDNHLKF
ncbi:MAG: hypothetical protein KAS02_01175 [Candidatus Pacebacteria bacterium]|nr:hypothetical protein [Candidatus Paceibacterota bacterium]